MNATRTIEARRGITRSNARKAPSQAARLARHWINGQWRDSVDHRDSINPASGAKLGSYAFGREDEAADAVAAAVHAFRDTDWKTNRELRIRVLNELADRFEAHAEDIADAISAEIGKIKPQSAFEAEFAAPGFRFGASLVSTHYGRAAEWSAGRISILLREAVGVAGICVPWNAPIALLVRSLSPALAAGCTVVVKMPEQSAQVNTLVSKVMNEVKSLPPGVINMVTGGREVLAHLVDSPDVPTISFTGSTRVGKEIYVAGAAHLKRFGLELGGKTPIIVFDDADLDAAVPRIAQALTVFAGQFCMTGSRLLVQAGVADSVRKRLGGLLARIRVGPASDPESEMGPLIDRANVKRVNQMVEDAIAAGAKVIVRGGSVSDGPLAEGAFYRPTLLEVTDSRMPIVQQEVFGPVQTMQIFETEADAIALANDSDYGLAASVWSRDVDRPLRVGREIQAGTVWINDWVVMRDEFEEGGYKKSGHGRLRGLSSLDDFVDCKHIVMQPGVSER